VYPKYEDTEEGHALEALEHPHGEDHPGAHDCYRKVLLEKGWDERELVRRFGPSSYRKRFNG